MPTILLVDDDARLREIVGMALEGEGYGVRSAASAEAATVTKRGRPLHLTKTEFKLLLALASRPNQVFTREVLLQQVWDYDYFGDSRLVDVHIRRLRAKIEDDPRDPRIVQTVRGIGYKVATR